MGLFNKLFGGAGTAQSRSFSISVEQIAANAKSWPCRWNGVEVFSERSDGPNIADELARAFAKRCEVLRAPMLFSVGEKMATANDASGRAVAWRLHINAAWPELPNLTPQIAEFLDQATWDVSGHGGISKNWRKFDSFADAVPFCDIGSTFAANLKATPSKEQAAGLELVKSGFGVPYREFRGRYAAISGNGLIVATADSNEEPGIVGLTIRRIAIWKHDEPESSIEIETSCSDLALNDDGSIVYALGQYGGPVTAWDTATGKEEFSVNSDKLWKFALSPDSTSIAALSRDGSLTIFDANGGEERGRFQIQKQSSLKCAAFFPDGKQIAIGDMAGEAGINIVDTENGKIKKRINVNSGRVDAIAVSPDGMRIAAAAGDVTHSGHPIVVWDVESGKETGRFVGHTNMLSCIEFSPDGSKLVSGGYDHSARVWDVAVFREILELPIPHATTSAGANGITSLGFSRDGTCLVTAGNDERAAIWSLNT